MIYTGRYNNLKIDPYEMCPCNSGAKYKFCCYKKAKEEKKNDDLHRNVVTSYPDKRLGYFTSGFWESSDFKTCYGFDQNQCVGKIKNAHSIQNNRILNRISEDSHLYAIKSTVRDKQARPELKKIGKNMASTFFGFCDYHDTEIFKPIELSEYSGASEQNYLFAFRALCLELHKKQRQMASFSGFFKEFPSFLEQNGAVYGYRTAQMDVRDYNSYYSLFRKIHDQKTFEDIKSLHFELDFEVKFATSSAFAVQYDLHGNEINQRYELSLNRLALLFLTIYPVEGSTNVIISYHVEDEEKLGEYFKQINNLSKSELTLYLNNLIIDNTENIFFKPSFIEGMTEETKTSLLDSFESSLHPLLTVDLIRKGQYFNFNLFT